MLQCSVSHMNDHWLVLVSASTDGISTLTWMEMKLPRIINGEKSIDAHVCSSILKLITFYQGHSKSYHTSKTTIGESDANRLRARERTRW